MQADAVLLFAPIYATPAFLFGQSCVMVFMLAHAAGDAIQGAGLFFFRHHEGVYLR